MKIIKRIHPGYEEFEKAKKAGIDIRQMFGKYQYLYKNKNGKISLINLPNYLMDGKNRWEIYCFEGNIFEDTEVFKTKKEAEKAIAKYLK